MRKVLLGIGALALIGTLIFTTLAPAAPPCFDQSRPVLPTLETVSATLTNGAAGLEVYRAVADGEVDRVATLLADDPGLLGTRTDLPEGVRPYNGNFSDLLIAAVASCDTAMVQTLLDAGADPDGAIPGLALTYAVLADDPGLATLLLEAGAAPDAHDPSLRTALHEALMYERADAVTLLASFGADVNRADAIGRIPLGSALAGQNWPEVQALIEAGANPWQVHNQGILPAYMIFSSPPTEQANQAIRDALLAGLPEGAPIWPPVNSTEVRTRFLDGSWPTAEMRAAGLFASDAAMEIMRRVGP